PRAVVRQVGLLAVLLREGLALVRGTHAPHGIHGKAPRLCERADGLSSRAAITGDTVNGQLAETKPGHVPLHRANLSLTQTAQTVAGPSATAAGAAARRALRLRANLYAVLVEHDGRVVMRVRVAPVRPHLEMQVRAGLRARTIRVADKLPSLDLLPDLHDSVD